MRNFTSLMIASALVVPVMTNAANYRFKHVDVQSLSQPMAVKTVSSQSAVKNKVQLPHIKRSVMTKAASRADEAQQSPIYEAPEGEVMQYSRSGWAFYNSWFGIADGLYEGNEGVIVEGNDGYVYFKNPISQVPSNTYLKGVKEGSSYVFELPQVVYEEDYGDMVVPFAATMMMYYADPVEDPEEEPTGWMYAVGTDEYKELGLPEMDNKFVININEDGTLSYLDPTGDGPILGLTDANDLGWVGYGEIFGEMEPFEEKVVEVPAGLQTEEYAVISAGGGHFGQVGFDGDDVYIKGVFAEAPEAWVKGSVADGKVSIASGQYMGVDAENGVFAYFMAGKHYMEWSDDYQQDVDKFDAEPAAVFDFDAEKKVMTTGEDKFIFYNASKDRVYYISAVESPVIQKQPADISLVPSAPYALEFDNEFDNELSFKIDQLNVDGYLLDVKNLYYRFYINDEPFAFDPEDYAGFEDETEYIHYEFWDPYFKVYGFGADHVAIFYVEGIDTIGVQQAYIVDGEIMGESEITTINIDLSGINDVKAQKEVSEVTYYNLMGQKVATPASGIFVKSVKYTDGSVKSSKVAKR